MTQPIALTDAQMRQFVAYGSRGTGYAGCTGERRCPVRRGDDAGQGLQDANGQVRFTRLNRLRERLDVHREPVGVQLSDGPEYG